MNIPDFFKGSEVDIREFASPNSESIPEQYRAEYIKRREAVTAVLGGSTTRAAAKNCKVNRQTLKDDLLKFRERGPDGKPLGFRACIPWRHRKESAKPLPKTPPQAKGPGAFSRLVIATPNVQETIDGFTAPLPTGKRKNIKFNALHQKVLSLVRKAHGTEGYPFDTPDNGRRALLTYIKRARKARLEAKAAATEESAPKGARLSQIFQLKPLDRIEYDAHSIDVDWCLSVPTPDGDFVVRAIKQVTLLAAICAVSRYLLGYVLTFGAYNQLDVLRLFHDMLLPWRPRELIVPNMAYAHGSVLGAPACAGRALRGMLAAGDNAFAHHADATKDNLTRHQRGVVNYGPAHVPEIRPVIEAFFRRIEQGALRDIAGGFCPATSADAPRTASTPLRGDDYPLHWEGMLDLIDVLAAGHNVTPHSGLHERLPVDVLRNHLGSDGWAFEVADPAQDARQLFTIRVHPTVRGGKTTGKLPYIEWQGAKYRSTTLENCRSKVGLMQTADVYLGDVRSMVLLASDGTVWSKLMALSPWDRTPHDLIERKRVNGARARGLVRIAGGDDAIEAYHAFVRSQAASSVSGAETYAQATHGGTKVVANPASPSPSKRDVAPHAGRFTFDNSKD